MSISIVVVLCFIVVEVIYFLSFNIQSKENTIGHITYFAGEAKIKKKAYEFYNQNHVNYMIETGAINSSKTKPHVIICQSKSTFEDAFMIAEVIKKNSFDSIFVIAADYHMARSYFFLQIALIGDDINTTFFQVPIWNNSWLDIIQKKNGVKLLYNEVVKLNAGLI